MQPFKGLSQRKNRMEAEEGSLRTSMREQREVKLKPVHSSLHELAHQFVETRLADRCIRQRLNPESAQGPLKKGTFFVLENDARTDPGFLIFLPQKPVIFMGTRSGKDGRKPPAWTLRMRVDQSLGLGGGSLLIATLDKVQHVLRIEDVWIWKGENLVTTETFTKRRQTLKDFVENHWIPDKRLMSGISTVVANPKPLSYLSEMTPATCFSVDLIPDAPNRRRFTFILQETTKVKQQEPALPTPSPQVPVPVTQTTPSPAPVIPSSLIAKKISANAVRVDGLPDVYDLFSKDGMPLSRAAVQQITLSQALRNQKVSSIPVFAEWKSEFGRYEILSVDLTAKSTGTQDL